MVELESVETLRRDLEPLGGFASKEIRTVFLLKGFVRLALFTHFFSFFSRRIKSHLFSEKPKDLDNWSYKARNTVLFNPEEAPLTVEEHIQRQKMNQRVINKEATRLPYGNHNGPAQVGYFLIFVWFLKINFTCFCTLLS